MNEHAPTEANPNTDAATNRLAHETSPYLLLHKHNPVDWYPWGTEALDRAQAENKPIFLSVGYATCYWCHVMERESFADPGVAALMNEHFVNIKLDREERPELDEIYMAATQLLTGQGGWPNSVFLTPDRRPFYAGTYFPPDNRYGRPSFRNVLHSMSVAWTKRRDEVEQQAEELEHAMRRFLENRGTPAQEPPTGEDVAQRSFASLVERFDAEHGGFGHAPKFPTPSNLILLEGLARDTGQAERAEQADRMLARTLDAMARGGIYDQIAGGFHRYATDRAWLVPHFEKMLYDNGLLLSVYAEAYARTRTPAWARVLEETVHFLDRELRDPGGAFWSAIDAETDGSEGAYHVWTRADLDAAIGVEDAAWLAPIYGFDEAPFFEGEYYVLHLPTSLDEQAQRRRIDRDTLLAQVRSLAGRLLEAREARTRPLVDDKVLTDWNGMMIHGLATAGQVLDRPDWIEMAASAATFVLETMRNDDGVLQHTYRAGQARIDAYLSDYVHMVRGLLALHHTVSRDGDLDTSPHLKAALALTREQCARLEDRTHGGFFTSGDDPALLMRSKEVFDGALPAANAIATLNLIELVVLTGDQALWDTAARTLRAFAQIVQQQPEGARTFCLAAWRFASLPRPPRMRSGPDSGTATVEITTDQTLVLDVSLYDEARRVVDADLTLDPAPADDDGFRSFALRIAIADGWHIYAPDPIGEHVLPVSLDASGATLRDVVFPEVRMHPVAGEGIERVYEGSVTVVGRVRVTDAAPMFYLRYQPCDDHRCLPQTLKELPLTDAASA